MKCFLNVIRFTGTRDVSTTFCDWNLASCELERVNTRL